MPKNDSIRHVLTPHQIRQVAVQAKMYPTTIQRWLRGDPVQPLSVERIEEALKVLGFVGEAET